MRATQHETLRAVEDAYAKYVFFSQLRLFLYAGIALPKALRMLEGETPDTYLRRTALALADETESGTKFSEAIVIHSSFSGRVVSTIYAGETSGNLISALDKVAQGFREKAQLAAV